MTMDLKNNTAAILYGVDDIRIEHHDVKPVGEHDVLLEMYCVGICGSDVHYWKHGRIADFILTTPMVLGHEAAGTVRQVGSKVTHLKPGDRVAIEPGVPCLRCDFCVGGRYNLCHQMAFCATPPFDGNLCRYYVQSATFCYKLPDNVSFEEGALLEPISVGVHACKRGGVTIGKKVLILGCGPIGLVNILCAMYMGAEKIVATDMNEDRLKTAAEFGAKTLKVTRDLSDEEFTQKVKAILGDLPDVTLDCGGFESTVSQGLKTTKSGGTMVVVGMGGPSVMKLPMQDCLIREVDVRGVFRYCNNYKDSLAMVASCKINTKALITHSFGLEDTVKAFETTLSGKAIKVMIYCQKQ